MKKQQCCFESERSEAREWTNTRATDTVQLNKWRGGSSG